MAAQGNVRHLQAARREVGILLPNNQRQQRTSHGPQDVLPSRMCADYCAPCQPLFDAARIERELRAEKEAPLCRGTSPIRKRPPPKDPPRTLGIGLQ